MVARLKELLGRKKSYIIVNGNLLCVNKSPLRIVKENYRLAFYVGTNEDEYTARDGVEIIKESISEFKERFDGILPNGIQNDVAEMAIDNYTGAVIITSASYRVLSDIAVHKKNIQHTEEVSAIMRDFVTYYTKEWMKIFVYLMNTRIASQSMRKAIRGRFIAGFYQPIVIDTPLIRSPFLFGENAWYLDLLGNYVEELESPADSGRKLRLNCVAMCDLAEVVGCQPVKELDRKHYMLIVLLNLLLKLNPDAPAELSSYWMTMFKNIAKNKDKVRLLSSISSTAANL